MGLGNETSCNGYTPVFTNWSTVRCHPFGPFSNGQNQSNYRVVATSAESYDMCMHCSDPVSMIVYTFQNLNHCPRTAVVKSRLRASARVVLQMSDCYAAAGLIIATYILRTGERFVSVRRSRSVWSASHQKHSSWCLPHLPGFDGYCQRWDVSTFKCMRNIKANELKHEKKAVKVDSGSHRGR